jgi:hypothetical protein
MNDDRKVIVERRPDGPPVTTDGEWVGHLVMVDKPTPDQAWRWADYPTIQLP